MPHISIKGETIFEIAGFPITNSLFTSLVVTVIFLLMGWYYKNQISKSGPKSWFFYIIHFMVNWIYDLYHSVMKEKTAYFFPLLGAIFFFVILNSWSGLAPGVGSVLIPVEHHGEVHEIPIFRAATADLNTTFALSILTVVLIQYFGVKALGAFGYAEKFINFKSPLDFIVGFLELISEVAKVISFSFRLFGNIFAGEVLITVVAFLVPVLLSGVFVGFEFFVGFMQAVVFSMLTAVFLSLAMAKHH